MMRKIFIVVLYLSLISGCARHRISKELRDFSRATVAMVDGMQSVCHRNISSSVWDNSNNKIRFVMYHDSLSCSSCQISHLNDYLYIYEKADTMSFEVLTIFSPRQDEYDEVIKRLMILDFPYPVYVDFDGSFRRANLCIPEDARFHSFLLNKEGHPVFVGNPIASDSMSSLFDRALEKLR